MVIYARTQSHPQVDVQAVDGFDLVISKGKVKGLQILHKPLMSVALRNDSYSALRCPSQKDLWRRFLVGCGCLSDGVVGEEAGCRLVHTQFNIALGTERGVRSDGDVMCLGEVDQSFLRKVRVKLDLKNLRFVAGISLNVENGLRLEVANTDVLGETFVDELLQRRPSFLDGRFA